MSNWATFAVYVHRQGDFRLHDLAGNNAGAMVRTVWVRRGISSRRYISEHTAVFDPDAPASHDPEALFSPAAWEQLGFVRLGPLNLPSENTKAAVSKWYQRVSHAVRHSVCPTCAYRDSSGNKLVTWQAADALLRIQGKALPIKARYLNPPPVLPFDPVPAMQQGPEVPPFRYVRPPVSLDVAVARSRRLVDAKELTVYAHPQGGLQAFGPGRYGHPILYVVGGPRSNRYVHWVSYQFLEAPVEPLPHEISPLDLVRRGFVHQGVLVVSARHDIWTQVLAIVQRVDGWVLTGACGKHPYAPYAELNRAVEVKLTKFWLRPPPVAAPAPWPQTWSTAVPVPPEPVVPTDFWIKPTTWRPSTRGLFHLYARSDRCLRLYEEVTLPSEQRRVVLFRAEPKAWWAGDLALRNWNGMVAPGAFSPREWERAGFYDLGWMDLPRFPQNLKSYLAAMVKRVVHAADQAQWLPFNRPRYADFNRKAELRLANFWRATEGKPPLAAIPGCKMPPRSPAQIVAREWGQAESVRYGF